MTIQEVLVYIGEKLNDEQIIWGVGGSVLLNHYSLAENPKDIDIFIALEDIHKADAILKKLGKKQDRLPNSLYKTDHFLEYEILGIGVEIPLTSLEDWYVIYQLLGDREVKVERIESYLYSTGLINTGILERALAGNLPEKVKQRIETLITSHSLALSKRK